MIHLVPTTRDNWLEALRLQVHEHQLHYVPSVAVSLAKVHIRPDGEHCDYFPLCIMSDDLLIGFVMVTVDVSTNWCYWMNGFLIDQAEQGKGYAKAAIQLVIDYVKAHYLQSICLNLTVNAENTLARALYIKCGFVETGDIYDGEVVYRLDFAQAK
ncbi:GNAT family N-acetyltransferase [Paenibacillus albiflavus]|uniref:GNAT family N-acetyltransferase n=1 Tax=Paenibacillus albiflavus TaxID=2545760 RepID=A0A4R4EQQ4_9BACL|nr:GNAT family N-acetyltransferase [Paenibacillus albiflavus]TCZ80951.1 GNAT family N-acetyltransferase [Paenibacillus albiflavus]